MRQLISRIAIGAGLATVAACANPGPPPGAPQRLTPPAVVELVPDTNATNVKAREVRVTFDAVISERPASSNATELADLVVVSPRHGEVNVDWHRDNITIRPKQGWKPNTTYTISILPGIADLQSNVRKERLEIVFSTGDSIASGMIRGTVFDWLQGKPAVGAIVEAVPRPDSLVVYTTRTDSSGNFTIRTPATGSYTVRTSINTTKDRVFDPRMAFDSTLITIRDSARLELLAYTHDSTGPEVGIVRMDDSVTLRATFNIVLDPTQTLDVAQFSLVGKDSTPVQIVSVTPITLVKPASDTTRTDSLQQRPAPKPDTTVRAKVPSKPLLFRDVIIVINGPLRPKTDYILRVKNIRSPSGQTTNSERSFTTPEPSPKPKDSPRNNKQ